MSEVEHRIKIAMGRLGTRDEAAEKIGVSVRTIGNWLKPDADVPLSKAALIAERADVSLYWLAGLTDDEAMPTPAINDAQRAI